MSMQRRTGTHRRTGSTRRRRARTGRVGIAALVAVAVLAVGCASFPDSAPEFSPQPSLTPPVATLVTPTVTSQSQPSSPSPSSASGSPSSGTSTPSSAATSTSTSTSTDPCAPSAPPVVARCLHAPWGLAPLPDGQSALVGERTTGKILLVAPEKKPTVVATVTGLDTSGGGGLLGIALSPYYVEDHLIYAYVTTSTDNRILRIAPGQKPKPIFTSIPAGDGNNGGPLAFGADGLLYVATGDATDAAAAPDPDSLAGKVLRLDAYGKPAAANSSGTAVFSSGLTDPTGMCHLPDGSIGVVDHRSTSDLLLPARDGADFTTPAEGDALWTYQPGNGGAVDCAVSDGALLATSLAATKVTSIQMTPTGGFTGSPQDLADGAYGRLLTIVTGPGQLVWMTTSNRDGHGKPIPSDDRVVLLPAGGGGGGGGGAD